MRSEITKFIEFLNEFKIMRNNIIEEDEQKAYKIICEVGYDFTSEEFKYIRETLKKDNSNHTKYF